MQSRHHTCITLGLILKRYCVFLHSFHKSQTYKHNRGEYEMINTDPKIDKLAIKVMTLWTLESRLKLNFSIYHIDDVYMAIPTKTIAMKNWLILLESKNTGMERKTPNFGIFSMYIFCRHTSQWSRLLEVIHISRHSTCTWPDAPVNEQELMRRI